MNELNKQINITFFSNNQLEQKLALNHMCDERAACSLTRHKYDVYRMLFRLLFMVYCDTRVGKVPGKMHVIALTFHCT